MRFIVGIVAALAGLWLVFVVALAIARPRGATVRETLAVLPDLLALLRGIAHDRAIPRPVRARLWFLLAYLASPIDLVPDFIPVIGFADDAILTYLVLRSVMRATGPETVRAHWSGTPDGLATVQRLFSFG